MNLPQLDTASFDAQLPLAIRQADTLETARALLETRLALAILAAPSDSGEGSVQLQRLEAKLDLSLELALRARAPLAGQPCLCRIGLDSIAWQQDRPLAEASQWLLSLQTGLDSALTLHLPVTIRHCEQQASGWLLRADWRGALPEAVQQNWERWVFRGHRQQVGKRR
ncbi:PilZ domain-containing protein [Vogesella oryzae]|uniref:PilZ domain-containing protein n=1 Tax=Vogesella oryzae TaxID=1735285 RepID=UPI001583228F|nr:PilZ domain-containing protein [Vogesella oryzae]